MMVRSSDRPRLVCRVAAGPRIGFGHLVRCRALARALDADLVVSIRGSAATRRRAARLGYTVSPGASDRAVAALCPWMMVVDDPSAAAAGRWVAQARRLGIPVATIHDLGIGYVPADMGIDGSVEPGTRMRGRVGDAKFLHAALALSQHFAWSAQPQVLFRYDKTVVRLAHDLEPRLGGFAQRVVP